MSLSRLPLQDELETGQLGNALFCHLSTRWYAGELFCHAAWIEALHEAGIRVSVCTKAGYLELFHHHPAVDECLPPESFDEARAAHYDLVVFAGTHPPSHYHPSIPLAIHSWNRGMAVVRFGKVETTLDKHETNHFLSSQHRHGQTALPDARYLQIHLTGGERAAAAERLAALVPTGSLIVLNPSSSNPHTRESDRPKAVDNVLSIDDYTALLRALRAVLPDDDIVIGTPMRAGDHANYENMRAIAARFADDPAVHLLEPRDPTSGEIGFREFAALLVQPRVRGMVGNSTGSNSHLAACVSTPSLSIERAADDAVRANWADRGRGQMGSLAWRNPHPSAGYFNLCWDRRTPEAFRRIAEAFALHLDVRANRWDTILDDPERAHGAARAALEASATPPTTRETLERSYATVLGFVDRIIRPNAAAFLYDFLDESEFLDTHDAPNAAVVLRALHERGACPSIELDDLEACALRDTLRDSNLFELMRGLTA